MIGPGTKHIMARALSEGLPALPAPMSAPASLTGAEMIDRLSELIEKMMDDGMSWETASQQAADLLAMEAGLA